MAKRVSVKGKGAELFFGDYPTPDLPAAAEAAHRDAPMEPEVAPSNGPAHGTLMPPAEPDDDARERPVSSRPRRSGAETRGGRQQASNSASTLASVSASENEGRIQAIRRVVKTPGREVSFVRLSPEEKGELADLVHAYKRQGFKTTENEINRIAINALLADYRARGEESILAKVLAALRA